MLQYCRIRIIFLLKCNFSLTTICSNRGRALDASDSSPAVLVTYLRATPWSGSNTWLLVYVSYIFGYRYDSGMFHPWISRCSAANRAQVVRAANMLAGLLRLHMCNENCILVSLIDGSVISYSVSYIRSGKWASQK